MLGLCRTSSDVTSELLYCKECSSCRAEFIKFTVWGNSPSLTCFQTDILLLVELLCTTWCLRIEDLLYVNLYETDSSKSYSDMKCNGSYWNCQFAGLNYSGQYYSHHVLSCPERDQLQNSLDNALVKLENWLKANKHTKLNRMCH